ncbi:hypothetical protein IFM89_015618 [Coptis chinensis]|uniref:Uncharacterized protein n=1 Tax=Coptis chinensis TaxID=261450 RepID=A0A835I3L5_9MAGN|nr:hypothetical protein IFM89_015618 [Coptis chinensis]
MIFDISDDEETVEPEARDELTENVVEEHIEPDAYLSQLDPIEHDFCTQNINDFLDELNESNNDHSDAVMVDVVRVDVDEEFNHGGRYDSSSQESDDEDYCPTDNEYSKYCFRHMYKSFRKVFSGELWENLAWGTAKAYKQQELTRILGVINKTDSKALDWLDTEPRSCWARAHFDWISKCDELTNNFSESSNSLILKIRDKPLVNFLDKYNLDLLQLVYGRRELSMSLMTGDEVPNVLFMIKKEGVEIQLDNIEELVLPPENTRKAGSPKKQRIRGEDEPLKTHRKCAKCGTPSHNTLTCDARKKGVHGKRRKPQDQETPTTPTQGGRGRAPGQDEVQHDAAPTQAQGGRGRSRRSRGGSVAHVPQPPPMQEAPPIQDEGARGGCRTPRGPTERS